MVQAVNKLSFDLVIKASMSVVHTICQFVIFLNEFYHYFRSTLVNLVDVVIIMILHVFFPYLDVGLKFCELSFEISIDV